MKKMSIVLLSFNQFDHKRRIRFYDDMIKIKLESHFNSNTRPRARSAAKISCSSTNSQGNLKSNPHTYVRAIPLASLLGNSGHLLNSYLKIKYKWRQQ